MAQSRLEGGDRVESILLCEIETSNVLGPAADGGQRGREASFCSQGLKGGNLSLVLRFLFRAEVINRKKHFRYPGSVRIAVFPSSKFLNLSND